jgi:hypothetical protein
MSAKSFGTLFERLGRRAGMPFTIFPHMLRHACGYALANAGHWLRRGVDGFRVDASAVLIEDDLLRDDPPNPEYDPKTIPPPQRLMRVFTDDRPETMDCLAELRAVIDEFPDDEKDFALCSADCASRP